jgi:naphthoate synthase
MCRAIRNRNNGFRCETRTRVILVPDAVEKFFCIGDEKGGMEDTTFYAGILPALEKRGAADTLQK